MTIRLRNLWLPVLLILAVGSAAAATKGEALLAEIEDAAAPYCLEGEVVHRVVQRSQKSGLYQVDLCQAGDPIGGRRYRAKLIGESWKFTLENRWLACGFSDPILQVRLMIPVDLNLARQMVEAVIDKLGPGEEISLVKALQGIDENGETYDAEPLLDTYSVTTHFLEKPGGRLFNFHAAADSVEILSVQFWNY